MQNYTPVRRIGEAQDPEEARRIVDALLVEGIESQVRPEDGAEIWVIDSSDVEPARKRLDVYRREGVPDATAKAKDLRRKDRREREAHVQRTHDLRGRWVGGSHAPGIVTIFLIIASVALGAVDFLAEPDPERMWNLAIDHWTSTELLGRVREGEVWRLVTPIFLHFGIFHLGFNMLWLWFLGNQVEHNHGWLTLVALVLAGALVGNVGQYLVTGPSFGGMSGVVYALFGFVWMNARFNRRYRYAIDDRTTFFAMLWFVACATGGFGPIANIAHAAGLVIGLVTGLPPYLRHLRAKADIPNFEAGGWADVQLRGLRRLRRRYITPYVPFWFLGLAAVVIAVEPDRGDELEDYVPMACQQALELEGQCEATLTADKHAAFEAEMQEALDSKLEKLRRDEIDSEELCPDLLELTEELARKYGCLE